MVSWDLTSVEGVSGGVTMNYTDGNGKKTAAGSKKDNLFGQYIDASRLEQQTSWLSYALQRDSSGPQACQIQKMH